MTRRASRRRTRAEQLKSASGKVVTGFPITINKESQDWMREAHLMVGFVFSPAANGAARRARSASHRIPWLPGRSFSATAGSHGPLDLLSGWMTSSKGDPDARNSRYLLSNDGRRGRDGHCRGRRAPAGVTALRRMRQGPFLGRAERLAARVRGFGLICAATCICTLVLLSASFGIMEYDTKRMAPA